MYSGSLKRNWKLLSQTAVAARAPASFIIIFRLRLSDNPWRDRVVRSNIPQFAVWRARPTSDNFSDNSKSGKEKNRVDTLSSVYPRHDYYVCAVFRPNVNWLFLKASTAAHVAVSRSAAQKQHRAVKTRSLEQKEKRNFHNLAKKIKHKHSEEVIEQEKHKIQKKSIVVEWKKKKKWRRRRTIDSERQSERSRRKKKKTTTKEKRLFCCFIYFCMRQCPRRASVSSYATLFIYGHRKLCVESGRKEHFRAAVWRWLFSGPFQAHGLRQIQSPWHCCSAEMFFL